MTLFGIDVSKWQSHLPDLSTCQFLFARASIGTTTDALYAQHIAKAKQAGIVTGAYHFNWDTTSIPAQVQTFIAAAGDVDLYALDVEGANAFNQVQTATFIQLMHAAGLKCGLYHSASGFFDAGQDWDWVAKWSTVPPASWDFWQYTSSGQLPGYTGRLDFDRFNGTLDELHKLAGKDGIVDSFSIPPDPLLIPVLAGAKLYDNSAMVANAATITVDPKRDMPYVGSLAGQVRIVEYIQTGGTSSHTAYYVAGTQCGTPKPAPVPPADCTAAIAADRSKAYVAYKP